MSQSGTYRDGSAGHLASRQEKSHPSALIVNVEVVSPIYSCS